MLRSGLFYLLCGFALLGVLDVGYFHLYRFKLYRVADSRAEQLTHLLRVALFVAALSWVMFIKAGGPPAIGLPLILLADFLNSMVDVWLEPSSRRQLGGLPGLEYAIHMMTMFVAGAIAALAVLQYVIVLNQPSRLALRLLGLPRVAVVAGFEILLISIGLCVFETVGFLSSLTKARSSQAR